MTSGDTFKGEFKDGMINGHGVYEWAGKKKVYEG
jgi:hypothetical protein